MPKGEERHLAHDSDYAPSVILNIRAWYPVIFKFAFYMKFQRTCSFTVNSYLAGVYSILLSHVWSRRRNIESVSIYSKWKQEMEILDEDRIVWQPVCSSYACNKNEFNKMCLCTDGFMRTSAS